MKTRLILLMLAGVVNAGAQTSEAWVRQTDLTNGMIYDIPLTSTGGTFQAPLPVSEIGSSFELYARGTAWDTTIYLLDTKLIRAYAPQVTVQVTSEDSYSRGDPASSNYVRRTRADRPFGLTIDVAGLVPASGSQAERQVYFATYKSSYNATTFSALNQTQTLISETNLGNGTVSLTPLYQELNLVTPTTACGEHVYSFVRYASDGVPDTTLVQSKVEVWPVADATIDNISAGQVITDRIPALVLHLKNLYPDSRTFAQVYPGAAVLGTAGTMIKGTERLYGTYYSPQTVATNVPQNQDITIDDLSNYAPTDGIYTLEVITASPFFDRAPERLLTVTFEVDRVISSRGQLSTAEP
ncbi:MAG: hypothetical protein U0984_09290 [Prosthecobacter sp.]|nr:hypothetical protein [Prosthecobacter sp.]